MSQTKTEDGKRIAENNSVAVASASRSANRAGVPGSANRSLEARYGKATVSRYIATVPAVLLRRQKHLHLTDENVVTIVQILSFYSSPPTWPSVSIQALATWRGRHWEWIRRQIAELEALGYVVRRRRDPVYGSWVLDLSPLLKRLEQLAELEAKTAGLRRAQARALETALADLSTIGETNREPNRGQLQSTTKEDELQSTEGEDATASLDRDDVAESVANPRANSSSSFIATSSEDGLAAVEQDPL